MSDIQNDETNDVEDQSDQLLAWEDKTLIVDEEEENALMVDEEDDTGHQEPSDQIEPRANLFQTTAFNVATAVVTGMSLLGLVQEHVEPFVPAERTVPLEVVEQQLNTHDPSRREAYLAHHVASEQAAEDIENDIEKLADYISKEDEDRIARAKILDAANQRDLLRGAEVR